MSKLLRFLPEAEAELRAAAEWYDDRAGLGDELAAEVRAATTRIAAAPEAFAPARGVRSGLRAREAPVTRFPYRVIFVELDEEVRVVALAHERRRPGYWRRRMES